MLSPDRFRLKADNLLLRASNDDKEREFSSIDYRHAMGRSD
jgi:hypothetical protein